MDVKLEKHQRPISASSAEYRAANLLSLHVMANNLEYSISLVHNRPEYIKADCFGA